VILDAKEEDKAKTIRGAEHLPPFGSLRIGKQRKKKFSKKKKKTKLGKPLEIRSDGGAGGQNGRKEGNEG